MGSAESDRPPLRRAPEPEELRGGALREAIANLVVKVYADHVGRGPTKVRAYVNEDVVVVLMEDTMTRGERTLVDSGREAAVLELRAEFQETMRAELTEGIEALTGRMVVAFMSGNSLAPDLASELFVLNGARAEAVRAAVRAVKDGEP